MAYRVGEIAQLINGRVLGDPGRTITDVNSLSLAGPQDISFISSPKHFKEAEHSRAGCLIAPEDFSALSKTVILALRPKASFVKIMRMFHADRYLATGIHPTALVDQSAVIGAEVSIGPMAVIGKDAKIGNRVRLGAGVAIGESTPPASIPM